MKQVLFGGVRDILHSIGTEYISLVGGYAWYFGDVPRYQVVSTDGKIKNLRVKLSGAPGAGKHYDFTLYLNGSPTALTLEIADAALSGSDMVHEIDVTGGDRVCLQCDPDNSPTAVWATWTCVFEGDTASESLIMGNGVDNLLNPAAIEYGQVMGSGTNFSGTENNFRQVCPTSGTIKNFYVRLHTDPGTAPDAYRFTLRKNGISTGLTVTITADDTTGSDLVNTVDMVAGDILTLMIEPLNTPSAAPYATWGMTFLADIDGESIVLGGSTDNLAPLVAADYIQLVSYESNTWSGIEDRRYQLGQVCTLKKLHVLLSAPPGAGNSYEFTIRVAGADSDVGAWIRELETTGHSSVSAKADIANDDYVDLKQYPILNPDVADAYWGLVCYTGPPIEHPYTEKIATFSIAADGAWTDYDLFTNQGVPKGAIAEIVCANKCFDFARIAGVRTDESGLNRYIDIHEAEGGGHTTATMFVKCHATTGLIECYAEIAADVDFFLLGYFYSYVDFTESITSLGNPGLAWADLDLTASGVPDDAVCQILMGNEATGADFFAGVRENGSALERGVVLDEAEGSAKRTRAPGPAGWSTLSMVVQSDAGAIIEWKAGSATDVTMWLLGWFSDDVSFTEGFTDYSPAANSWWTEKTIAEAAVDSVAAFALVHQDSGSETVCGLIEQDSILDRGIAEHEAEGGSFTGFQACIFLGADKKCDVYCQDASEAEFSYTGYFIIVEAMIYETSARLIGTIIAPYSAPVRLIGVVYRSYSTQVRNIGNVLALYSSRVRNIGTVIAPFSALVRLIGSVYRPYSARARLIGVVALPFSVQVRNIGSVYRSYSALVRTIGSVYRSFSTQVRNIGKVVFPYSSRVRLIGTVVLPFTARVRNIGTVIAPYSSQVRLVGSTFKRIIKGVVILRLGAKERILKILKKDEV